MVYIDTPYDLVETGAFEPLDSYFTAEARIPSSITMPRISARALFFITVPPLFLVGI